MHYFIFIVLAGYSACDPQIPYNWTSSLANSVDQNCECAFQTPYNIRLSVRYMKHRNLRLSVETKQGRKTSGASKICSIFCIKYIDLSVVLTYRQEKKTCSALILFKMRVGIQRPEKLHSDLVLEDRGVNTPVPNHCHVISPTWRGPSIDLSWMNRRHRSHIRWFGQRG